ALCDIADLEHLCRDGKLAREKVIAINPSIKEFLDEGIEWVMIRNEILHGCPGLPEFLQDAGNSGHQTERTLTKMQLLMEIHAKGGRNLKKKGEFDWPGVVTNIESGKPRLKGQIKDLTKFVENWSGGHEQAPLLNELDIWSKLMRTKVDVPSSVFKILGTVEFASAPDVIIAMVKSAMCSPENYVKNGVSTLLTSWDVQNLVGKNKNKCLEFSEIVRMAKQFLDGLSDLTPSPNATDKNRLIGRKTYDDLNQIACEFLGDVYLRFPGSDQKEAPFDVEPDMQQKGQASSASGPVGFKVSTRDGDVSQQTLVQRGLLAKAVVERKVPPFFGGPWTIARCEGPRAILEPEPGDDDAKKRATSKKADQLKVPTGQLLDEYQDHQDVLTEGCKASVRDTVMTAYRITSPAVDLTIKYATSPTGKTEVQEVACNRPYEPGQLIIVPLSINVGACSTDKVPEGAVIVDGVGAPSGTAVYLAKCCQLPVGDKKAFAVPYWCIPEAEDDDSAPLAVGKLKLDLACAPNARGMGGCSRNVLIPVLRNTTKLKKGTAFARPSPSSPDVPLSGANERPRE
ncbi:unnamed protein product, partial [Prorocentrum cordatum]